MALEVMQRSGQSVAVVLARQWMAEMNGSDLLARLRTLHPQAKRVLLISPGEWGDQRTAHAIRAATASGCTKPQHPTALRKDTARGQDVAGDSGTADRRRINSSPTPDSSEGAGAGRCR